jgi:hypothetical protein
MAVEAPFSKYKKGNYKIGIVVCLVLAAWCAYDGYFNKEWIQEHREKDGTPQTYLVVNKQAPPYLIGAAVLLGIGFWVVKDKKLVADDNELIIDGKIKISYNVMQKIDKTYFDSNGFFVITYTNESNNPVELKLSDRRYDNLEAVLETLVAKMS